MNPPNGNLVGSHFETIEQSRRIFVRASLVVERRLTGSAPPLRLATLAAMTRLSILAGNKFLNFHVKLNCARCNEVGGFECLDPSELIKNVDAR